MSFLRALGGRMRSQAPTVWLEIVLMAVAFAAMVRVLDPIYSTSGHRNQLLVTIGVAIAVSIVVWLVGIPAEYAIVASVVGYIVFATYTLYSDALTGGIPLIDAAQAVWTGSTEGWSDLLSTPTPAEPIDALLAAPTFVLWAAAALATELLLRSRLGALALAPLAAAWLALLVLGPGSSASFATTATIIGAVLLFLAVHAVSSGTGRTQSMTSGGALSRRRVYTVALMQSLPIVLLIGLVATFASDRTGLVSDDERQSIRDQWVPEVDSITSVTPLAQVRAQLSAAAEADAADTPDPVFTIDFATAPPAGDAVYVRYATLEDFDDGALWRMTGTFSVLGSKFPAPPERGPGAEVQATIELDDIDSPWMRDFLPTVGEPLEVDDIEVAFNTLNRTIIRAPDSDDGRTYRVRSAAQLTIDDVDQETGPGVDSSVVALSRLGADIPETIAATLAAFEDEAGVTAEDSPVTRLVKLRDAMADTTFSLDITRADGHSLAAVGRYLGRATADSDAAGTVRVGVSEQSASALAVLARSPLDATKALPARVAVGYRIPTENIDADGAATATIADTRAWAEVFLDGQGWVIVDPIVTRTNSAEPPEAPAVTEDPDFEEDVPDDAEEATFIPPEATPLESSTTWWPWIVLAGVLALGIAPLVKFVRRRRRIRIVEPGPAVLAAWAELRDTLVDHGLAVPDSATELDVARSALHHELTHESQSLLELADLAAVARWSDLPVEPESAADAWNRAADVVADVRARSGLRRRIAAFMTVRSLGGRWLRGRGRKRPAERADAFGAEPISLHDERVAFDDVIADLTASEPSPVASE